MDGVPCVEELGIAKVWCLCIETFWYKTSV